MVYDLDSIKQQNPIADVVAKHGVALRETGSHLVGRCPFHEDEHPSLVVYPETRSFYCFGCNAGTSSTSSVARGPELP
jgi:DNA primase